MNEFSLDKLNGKALRDPERDAGESDGAYVAAVRRFLRLKNIDKAAKQDLLVLLCLHNSLEKFPRREFVHV